MTPQDTRLNSVKKIYGELQNSLKRCSICPRRCGVNRQAGRIGYCRAPAEAVVYSYCAHHGEEPPLSGANGSGTIFFSGCNMKCVYCQNYYFSQLDNGSKMTADELAGAMLELEKAGCHNINLVSPTHYVHAIIPGLEKALDGGLNIPIVYNTGGYDLPETINLLDGIVDIYMPDMRYSDDKMSLKYSDAPDYVEYNRASIIQMYRQVGGLVVDDTGIAKRGLVIRLLVLPGDISGTVKSLEFIKNELGGDVYLSMMSQYYPTFKAYDYKEISGGVAYSEYKNIVDEAARLGLNNGWIQKPPGDADARFFGTNIKPKKDIK